MTVVSAQIITATSGRRATLQERYRGTWHTVRTARTAAGVARFTLPASPRGTAGTLRVYVAADASADAATSASRTVRVR